MVEHVIAKMESDLPRVELRLESWTLVRELLEQLPAKMNLVIPKGSLTEAPPMRQSALGRKRGAIRQFRDARPSRSIHVKEYAGHWVCHLDAWNPHEHVVRHLMVDRGYSNFLHLFQLAPLVATILGASARAAPRAPAAA
jgi:hypothetical protein